MLKSISLPSPEHVAGDVLAVLSATPVSVSPNGQLAVVDILYSNGISQLHAFMLVDLTSESYLINYNEIIGSGDATSVKTYTAGVFWNEDGTPNVTISYEDLADPASSSLYNRIAMVKGSSLDSHDLIQAASGFVADGSVHNIIVDDSGRYVAFETSATNLAATGRLDTNTVSDVYLIDTVTDTLTRVSALADGSEAYEESQLLDIANFENGVHVLFSTLSSEVFSADDTNTDPDLYLSRNSEIILVSATDEGIAGGFDGGQAGFVGGEIAFLSNNLIASDNDGLLDLYFVDVFSLAKRLDPVVNAFVYDANYDVRIDGYNDTSVILGLDGVSQGLQDLSNQLIGVDTYSNTSEIYTLNSGGIVADDISFTPSINDAGNTIVFNTSATNLVPQEALAFVAYHVNTEPIGTLDLDNTVRVGQTVSVDMTSFSDVDGFGSDFTFKWQLDGYEQIMSNENAFTLTNEMLGRLLDVSVEYVDNWGASEIISLYPALIVQGQGLTFSLGGKVLNHGTIIAELDGDEIPISSDTSYFDLIGSTVGSVTLDPAMHTSDIDIGDVIASLRHIVGLQNLTGKFALAADVDNDSVIGIGDVIAQLRHLVGLDEINQFDVLDSQGSIVSGGLQSQYSVELILNGDVDLSTQLTPSFYDI